MEITIHNGGEYREVLAAVLRLGEPHEARGLKTLDVDTATVNILNPYNALPLGVGRKLSTRIAAVEAVQLIAGESYPELVVEIAPQFSRYSDDRADGSPWFHGAYGTRIIDQVYHVIRKLKKDPGSRQAVITLWNPELDNSDGAKDYPCTCLLRFAIRDGLLNMNVVMRSNDVWLGFPYDIFQFTQLQISVMRALNLKDIGTYRHTALSLHLYDSNLEQARALIDAKPLSAWNDQWQPRGIGRFGDSWTTIQQRARDILWGYQPEEMTNSERWYCDQLYPSNMG